jgi:hypothetical protein
MNSCNELQMEPNNQVGVQWLQAEIPGTGPFGLNRDGNGAEIFYPRLFSVARGQARSKVGQRKAAV